MPMLQFLLRPLPPLAPGLVAAAVMELGGGVRDWGGGRDEMKLTLARFEYSFSTVVR